MNLDELSDQLNRIERQQKKIIELLQMFECDTQHNLQMIYNKL